MGPKAVSKIKEGLFGLGGFFFLRGGTDDLLQVAENVVSAIFLVESTSIMTWTLENCHRKKKSYL